MPVGIIRSKPVKPPQHLFQIVGYVHDVVDGITDKGFARNLFGIGRAIVAQSREARVNVRTPNATFGRRPLVALIGIAEGCVVVAQGKRIQMPRKHLNGRAFAFRDEIDEALSGNDVRRQHAMDHSLD